MHKKRWETSALNLKKELPQNTTEFNDKIQNGTQKGPMNYYAALSTALWHYGTTTLGHYVTTELHLAYGEAETGVQDSYASLAGWRRAPPAVPSNGSATSQAAHRQVGNGG